MISGLANDENTIPGQLAGSGDQTIPECEQSESGEKTEQLPGSGEETDDVDYEDQSSRSIEILQSEVKKCNLGR